MPLPSNITFRPARPSDVSSICDCVASAPDDGIYYECRNLSSHWTHDLWQGFNSEFRHSIHNPTYLWRIAVIPDPARPGKEQVIGFSGWRRYEAVEGKAPIETKPRQFFTPTWTDTLNTYIGMVDQKYNAYYQKLHPWGPRSQLHRDAIMRERTKGPDLTSENPSWVLCGLAVSPTHQGMGIGKALVKYGMDIAEQEKVPVFSGSEGKGLQFYLKGLGWKVIPGTEFWLDTEGKCIAKEDTERDEGWKRENGGVNGAEIFWLPKGVKVEIEGEVFGGE